MCSKCNKTYGRKQHIVRHVQYECGKQPIFQCPLCPRRCKRKDVLQTHLRNVHKILPISIIWTVYKMYKLLVLRMSSFQIPCFMWYNNNFLSTWLHYLILGPFECPCGRSYSMYKNLKRHQTVECGKEPRFRCRMCGYGCFRNNVMTLHYLKKHHVALWNCKEIKMFYNCHPESLILKNHWEVKTFVLQLSNKFNFNLRSKIGSNACNLLLNQISVLSYI